MKRWLRTGLGQLHQYDARALDLTHSPPARTGPTMAVATPSFNQAEFLGRTAASVLDQRYPTLDYVVQDGASTDGTADVLARLEGNGARVWSEPDSGQAEAINRGLSRTTGEIMGWLNSDDILLPGALQVVGEVFERHPEVDVVYGHRIIIDSHDREIGRWIMPAHDSEVLTWADYIPQETMFWRRTLWDRVGGLDESFRFALDWDLLLRFRDAGARFHRIPRFLGGFRVHESQKTSAEIESVGVHEMQRLRTRCVGRPVSQREVSENVRPYLAKASLYSLMWKLRMVNYGPL